MPEGKLENNGGKEKSASHMYGLDRFAKKLKESRIASNEKLKKQVRTPEDIEREKKISEQQIEEVRRTIKEAYEKRGETPS